MPAFSKGTVPANFLDSVTAGVRLPTPQPQYWFARQAIGARLSLAAIDAGATSVQQFISEMGTGEKLSPELDSLIRAADAYPDTILAIDNIGKEMGDTVKFRRDIYSNPTVTAGTNAASREVNSATVVISTTGQAVQMEENIAVLKEYGGPIMSGATAITPYAIADFDAKYRRAKESLASATSRFLRQDYIQWLDGAIKDEFARTANITYSDQVANVLSMTNGAGHGANLQLIMDMRKSLSDRNWAKFGNGRYTCLVPSKFNSDMVSDVDYRELSKVHEDGRNLLYGYIGSIQDVDLFEVTTLNSYAAGVTVTGDGNAVPASVTVQECLMFGPGTVGFGTALPPEARFADDTNYGTIAKMIWYAIHAFAGLDTRGVQRGLFQ